MGGAKDWRNPPTPGALPLPTRMRGGGQSDDWIVRGLCVVVGGGGSPHEGKVGVVVSVSDGSALLAVEGNEAEKFTVSTSHLRPAVPRAKGDRVMVIHGERRHTKMIFVAFDGDEGVLRLEGQEEIYIAHLSRICRYREE